MNLISPMRWTWTSDGEAPTGGPLRTIAILNISISLSV